jgi:hypothetical protein
VKSNERIIIILISEEGLIMNPQTPAELEAALQTALNQVIADETTLQQAVAAIQSVVTVPPADPNDAVVASMVEVLVNAGLVTAVTAAPNPAPASDEQPASGDTTGA